MRIETDPLPNFHSGRIWRRATELLSLLTCWFGSTTAVVAAGYPDAVLADSPVAYWRFSDTLPVATNCGSLGPTVNGTYFAAIILHWLK